MSTQRGCHEGYNGHFQSANMSFEHNITWGKSTFEQWDANPL